MQRTKTTVAEALGRAHKKLLKDLQALEQAVPPVSGESVVKLRHRLSVLRADLVEHFRFEERDGYMAQVRKQAPRLERVIEELSLEHRQLLHCLDTLAGQVGVADNVNDKIAEGVRDWIAQVRQHENRENDVVQDAFNLDIGAED